MPVMITLGQTLLADLDIGGQKDEGDLHATHEAIGDDQGLGLTRELGIESHANW